MIAKRIVRVFHRGSRTYFYSSLFFPKAVREDVFRLYAFVRVADDFVDRVPQDREGLARFEAAFRRSMAGTPSGDVVIDSFVELAARRTFEPGWVDSFLDAMRSDLAPSEYKTMADVESYMYGSAEVIGLMMARIMDLPDDALAGAQRLGRAMQYVNFLRDVAEDAALGRRYIPGEALAAAGLAGVTRDDAASDPDAFARLMRAELDRYRRWQRQAEDSFPLLPYRARVAIQTASDMYAWTADVIERQPTIVFQRKVRPPVLRIVLRLTANALAVAAARPKPFTESLGRLRAIFY